MNPTSRISKKIIYLLFIFNFFLGLFLRYSSSIGIEKGSPDSWDYHLQINQIILEGKISWIFHPLSYYGMYPPYMEMGIETFTSSISLLSGISVTLAILATSLIIGILSSFFAFILSKAIFKDRMIAIVFALVFSCSTLVYQSTVWGISRREFVSILMLIPLFFLIRIYTSKDQRLRYSLLFLVSLLVFSSVHKSSIFMLVYLILFISLVLIRYYILKYSFVFTTQISAKSSYNIFFLITTIILIGSFLNNDKSSLQIFLIELYNDAFDMSLDLGLLGIFGIFALFNLHHWRIDFLKFYFILLFTIAIFIHVVIPQPRGLIREPVSFYMFIPIYFCLMSLGLVLFTKVSKITNFGFPLLVALILVSSLAPEFIVVNPEGDEEADELLLYNLVSSSTYINHKIEIDDDSQVIGYGLKIDRIMSFANGKFFYPPMVTAINFTKYEFDISVFFESRKAEGFVKGEGLRYEWILSENYLKNDLNSPRVKLDFAYYQIEYVFIDSLSLEENPANLISQISTETYTIFSDNNGDLYYTKMN
mgnify:CR=1 FL=1